MLVLHKISRYTQNYRKLSLTECSWLDKKDTEIWYTFLKATSWN
eukprot:SAG11_NODE_27345_length_333_cov_11.316239_1_plen_43_part_01